METNQQHTHRPLTWEFRQVPAYARKRGQWRWRAAYANGKIAGVSSESYHNRSECEDNARDFGWKGGEG